MTMTVTIRLLGREDAAVLDRVAEDVFDSPVADEWRSEFFADCRHHLAVAIADGEVVGMASAVHYVHPDKGPQLWINEVGVAPLHQGHGIGKQLLTALFDRARSLGCNEAWVLTEQGNERARRLYASLGGVVDQPVMYNFQLDEPLIDPGV